MLGAMMLSPRALQAASALLDAGHFYRPGHGVVFERLVTMANELEFVDAVTLASALECHGEMQDAGGRGRIHELAALVPSTSNVEHYARIVRRHALSRHALGVSDQLRQAALNGGLAEHPETTEELLELIEGGHGNALPTLDLVELLAGPTPETDWLWNRWLAWEDVVLLVGDPGVGKSLLALGLAEHIRRGEAFLGEPTAKARVGIIDLENPLSEIHKRLRRVGLDSKAHSGIIYVHAPPLRLTDPEGIARLRATIAEHELEVIIIDSFRRACPGIDENDSAAISAIFAPLRHLTANQRRVIIVIHHARKRVSDQDSSAGQMTRGSGDFLAVVDTQLYVRKKEAGVFTLEHGKSRRGLEHEAIQVRVSEADDEHLTFLNEGVAAIADTKLDVFLVKIIEELRELGGHATTTVLKMRVGPSPKQMRTFYLALKVGVEKGWLGQIKSENRREPDEYSLTEESW